MKTQLIFSLCIFSITSITFADSIALNSVQDNSIYADNTSNSNGAGDFLFTGQNGGSSARRTLIQFDLGLIPTNATIQNVSLDLFVSQAGSGVSTDVSMHRLTSDWGESTSDAPGGEGGGTSAEAGDATWQFNFFDNSEWASAGGDFDAAASATTAVDIVGSYQWTSPNLVDDVQNWLSGNVTNFGWIIIGDETAASTSKRFNSRTNASNTPTLTIDFTTVPEPNSGLLMLGMVGLLNRRRRR